MVSRYLAPSTASDHLRSVGVIFGAGPVIGRSTALRLKSEGYKVAVASRKPDVEKAKADGFFPLPLDLARTSTVAGAFDTVVKELGVPSVLVYNGNVVQVAQSHIQLSSADGFLSPTLAEFEAANSININSFYSVLQEFIKHGKTLPSGTLKTVLFTGNALNKIVMPSLLTLGVGKSAAAHIIAVGAHSSLVQEGFRFYFVDERTAEGAPIGPRVNGPAHAEVFFKLHQEKEQKPWNATFLGPGNITQF